MSYECPYIIEYKDSTLLVLFKKIVNATDFFANIEKIQGCLDYDNIRENKCDCLCFDLHNTIWFDTLALCYLMLFIDALTQVHKYNIKFILSAEKNDESILFNAFLKDNGFYNVMTTFGTVDDIDKQRELSYSNVHKCVWPLQILHHKNEIGYCIDLIKDRLNNELKSEIQPSELEYTINKVTYFLRETIDNSFIHGYLDSDEGNPCAILIKRVKSGGNLDLRQYKKQYIDHTPYIDVSLYEDKHEYLEIYIVDIGVGLRHSFLEDADGVDCKVTDENIVDYIFTEGKRSYKRITDAQSTKYGGLYDIVSMFKGDGDRFAIKGDSRWFTYHNSRLVNKRINNSVAQHVYGKSHGFGIIGNISWTNYIYKDYLLSSELKETIKNNEELVYTSKNQWMIKNYCQNISIIDNRLSSRELLDDYFGVCIFFPKLYLYKKNITDFLNKCNSHTVIFASVHESEYKKYQTIIENLNLRLINPEIKKIIIISDTLFPKVFIKKAQTFKFNKNETLKYINQNIFNDENKKVAIENSFTSFRMWKKVYDSELMWESLAKSNPMGYINTQINWGNEKLRGYLDFSQLCLVADCCKLCIEQLKGFQVYGKPIYFCSLDRFTDEICEQANHQMNNSPSGDKIWIGSVFVSGTSERRNINLLKNSQNTFYFFKHIDSNGESKKLFFEWATMEFRINEWFPPKLFIGKQYGRVGNTSFIADNGSSYWSTRHFDNWDTSYNLSCGDTYKLLQTEYGVRPAILKLGHFVCEDHHDLFEINTDVLVEADRASSQLKKEYTNTSYDYLLTMFIRALIPYKRKDKVYNFLNPYIPNNVKECIYKKYSHTVTALTKNEYGFIVYLTDYKTAKIIDLIKFNFSEEIQQRIIPIIPFEKDYISSTLFISPLLLDSLQMKIDSIKKDGNKVKITLFMANNYTTRLQNELKHIMLGLGAHEVKVLSIVDRQRLPSGVFSDSNSSYCRLDLPAIGLENTCPICTANELLSKVVRVLRDKVLVERVEEIMLAWKRVKGSDNSFENGIPINYINIPQDIQSEIIKYQDLYQQGKIDITTDLGLVVFAIENTGISLCTDFLDVCLKSKFLGDSIKILLISTHVITFNVEQISEKYFCKLMEFLCDLLSKQEDVNIYTSLAVIAICSRPDLYQYIQNIMMRRSDKELDKLNNDILIAKLALFCSQSEKEQINISAKYATNLFCYLKGNNSALELIYDIFLYTEIDYIQSHRQAFSQIIGTVSLAGEEIYKKAMAYIQKIEYLYKNDSLRQFYHDSEKYDEKKGEILEEIINVKKILEVGIKDDAMHQELKNKLRNVLQTIQVLNQNLYLRAADKVNDNMILKWIEYCEKTAQNRIKLRKDSILKIVDCYNYKKTFNFETDVRPWFYSFSDVTEEVINLICDMMKGRSSRLKNIFQNDISTEAEYDGIIRVCFEECYVEILFYNITDNPKKIDEIRKIKKSKMNRQTSIVFNQYEYKLEEMLGRKITCFEWEYDDETFSDIIEKRSNEHLFCATLRIPYIDMGSSFGV